MILRKASTVNTSVGSLVYTRGGWSRVRRVFVRWFSTTLEISILHEDVYSFFVRLVSEFVLNLLYFLSFFLDKIFKFSISDERLTILASYFPEQKYFEFRKRKKARQLSPFRANIFG